MTFFSANQRTDTFSSCRKCRYHRDCYEQTARCDWFDDIFRCIYLIFCILGAPLTHNDRFADCTAFLQSVETETREFADTKRVCITLAPSFSLLYFKNPFQVDIFRAELKRAIKDKINVMSKKMATRQEVKATFDYLHKLLSGENVADYQGTRSLSLRGNHIATQWTITFIIDTYLVRFFFERLCAWKKILSKAKFNEFCFLLHLL